MGCANDWFWRFSNPTLGDGVQRPAPKWLTSAGGPAPATTQGLATQTEPPQVSLPVAQIRWHRTRRLAALGRPGVLTYYDGMPQHLIDRGLARPWGCHSRSEHGDKCLPDQLRRKMGKGGFCPSSTESLARMQPMASYASALGSRCPSKQGSVWLRFSSALAVFGCLGVALRQRSRSASCRALRRQSRHKVASSREPAALILSSR
jgi:hypothetical protein